MPSKKRIRWIVAALALLLLVLWLAVQGRHRELPAQRSVQSATPISLAVSGIGASPMRPSRLHLAAQPPQGAASEVCTLPYAAMVRRTYGARPEDAEKPEDLAAREARERTGAYKEFSAGVRRIDDALRTSPDPYANAVGVWLDLPRDESGERAVPEGERRRQLAALAVRSTDPRLYALAFETCRGSLDDGCHVLSARRWVDLDAGNALPWAFLLQEAVAKGDVSGQQEAWFHMAKADRFDERSLAQLAPIIASSNGSAGDQVAAESLSVLAIGIAAAWPLPWEPWRGCARPAARADSNRAQLCTSLADVMFEQSDSIQRRSLGASLTKRLSGDATRSAIVNQEIDAWVKEFKEPGESSCESLDTHLAHLSRAATVGAPRFLREAASDAAH